MNRSTIFHLAPGLIGAVLSGVALYAYYSAVTITTLGYGDFVPVAKSARRLVIWELGTGLLLLVGIFSLLISRLADF